MSSLLPGNIIYGGPINSLETMNYRSLGHYILDKLNHFDDRYLMINAITGMKYTAKMIYDASVQLAYALQSLGIKKGNVVGICSENRFEFAVTLYATFAINATIAPLNVTYTESEVQHALNLSRPKIVFASKQTTDRIVKVAKNNSFVKHIIDFDTTNSSSKIHSYKELMKNPKIATQTDFFSPTAYKNEDVALIVYSSGTTGLPKGVQLTQANILYAVDPAVIELTSIYQHEFLILSVIPWCHIFGCITLISDAAFGSTLVYLPKFVDHIFLQTIEKYRINLIFMVPPLMVFLAKHALVPKFDLSSLKALYCGAAPLNRKTVDQIKKRFGMLTIRQGYGLSETTRGILIQNDRYCKPGSVGELRKGMYAKVVDPDSGRTLGPNQCGELYFKGCYIMKSYVDDIKSTESVVRDGWLQTGDVGYYDNDFEFFIVDRIKELIKYKGFQVPPAEIEALLLTNAKVKDAAVIGKPDEEAGELPIAFIVKQDNVHLTEDEVIKFVAERTSPAKRLRGGVVFVNEIPKNVNGKILRRVLRDMLKKKVQSKL